MGTLILRGMGLCKPYEPITSTIPVWERGQRWGTVLNTMEALLQEGDQLYETGQPVPVEGRWLVVLQRIGCGGIWNIPFRAVMQNPQQVHRRVALTPHEVSSLIGHASGRDITRKEEGFAPQSSTSKAR
jgi:hypothetical protein